MLCLCPPPPLGGRDTRPCGGRKPAPPADSAASRCTASPATTYPCEHSDRLIQPVYGALGFVSLGLQLAQYLLEIRHVRTPFNECKTAGDCSKHHQRFSQNVSCSQLLRYGDGS
jgi:hypothetical protein